MRSRCQGEQSAVSIQQSAISMMLLEFSGCAKRFGRASELPRKGWTLSKPGSKLAMLPVLLDS
jgi:hypothetical protein